MKVRRRMRPASAWLLGVAVGIAGTLPPIELGVLGLLLYVAMIVTLLATRRVAAFGGASFGTGVWFSLLWSQSLERCDAFNRNGGFCQVYNASTGAAIATSFLVLGIALSAYGLLRSDRGA